MIKFLSYSTLHNFCSRHRVVKQHKENSTRGLRETLHPQTMQQFSLSSGPSRPHDGYRDGGKTLSAVADSEANRS